MTAYGTGAVALGVAALLGAAAVVWSSTTPLDGRAAAIAPVRPPPRASAPQQGRNGVTAAAVARRNVFRSDRSPPGRPFEPFAAPAPPPPPVPAPSLTLLGVMLGTPRAAVLGGLPGEPGPRLLEEGERVGDVRVLRVTADSATVLVRADTLRLALQGR